MKIAKWMIASFVVLLPMMAQEEKTEESKGTEVLPQNWPVKMFQVKYANVGQSRQSSSEHSARPSTR